jgi:hypothetical protein
MEPSMSHIRAAFLCVALLGGCDSPVPDATASPPATQAMATPEKPSTTPVTTTPVAMNVPAQASAALDPSRGQEVGLVFEAYLSPHQEAGEEEETPKTVPKEFKSTTPSQDRAAREAAGHRGHGRIRFTKDLSRAFVDVKLEGVDPATINMFHIHCGNPGVLGPILIDFAHSIDIQKDLVDGVLSVELKNEHLVKVVDHGHGLVGAFTAGCPIPDGAPTSRVSTVAGMLQYAVARQLYFNLHTTGQTYFGDLRGQVHPVTQP